MEKIRNRYIISIVIIVIGAAMVHAFEYNTFYKTQDAISTIKNIPLQVGNWQGKDVFMPEDIYEILATRAIIHRSYQFGNQHVFLSLVYYPDTKVNFHTPEACLGGRGRKTQKSARSISLETGDKKITLKINQLNYIGGPHRDIVYYFFKAGSFIGKNYILLRLNLAKNKLAGHGTSGSLIRISTADEPISGVSAEERLNNFITDLYPYLLKL